MRRGARLVLACLLVLSAGVAGGWALAHVTDGVDPGQQAAAPVTAQVTSGTISDEMAVTASAEWTSRELATNRRAGVVTSVAVATGDEVGSGDVLFAVNLVPVVAAKGELPLFRDVGTGIRGPDVMQVQRFLAEEGFYRGRVDGDAGAGTVGAIRAWQEHIGAPVTGVIQPGQLLMVPTLPVRVQVDTKVLRVGAELAGGEKVVRAFASRPVFTVATTDLVAAQLSPQITIAIDRGDGEAWPARAERQTVDAESGQTIVTLVGPDAGPVCGEDCASVPYKGTTTYAATAVTVPPETGSLVPAAAIATDAAGASVVVLEDGRQIPVTVLAVVGGLACVSGVVVGQRVRIPAGIGG